MLDERDAGIGGRSPRQVFNKLFEENYVRVRRYVETFVDCDDEVDTFVQEVFALAWEKLDLRQPFTSTWLLTTARHKIQDAQKHRDVERRILGKRVPLTTGPLGALPPDIVERMAVRQALLTLSDIEAQRSAVSGMAGSTVAWLFTDEQGTVDVRTNALTGATTQQYRDPFGAPLAGTSSRWADTKGFLNKPVALTVGLTTIGARMYDPVLGKFLSVDPVIDTNVPQQNIGYAYSGNNPITYSDPSGLKFAIANSSAGGAAGICLSRFRPARWPSLSKRRR